MAPPQASLVLSSNLLSLTEGGADVAFTVKLSAQPTDTVTITLASSDGTVANALPATLTFAPATYSTPQTVTVSAPDDAVLDATRSAQITLTAASNDADFAGKSASVQVSVTNSDVVRGGRGWGRGFAHIARGLGCGRPTTNPKTHACLAAACVPACLRAFVPACLPACMPACRLPV